MELRLHNPYRDTAARTEHKDLGQVAANQTIDGLPVINRTKNLLDPFSRIVKTPCFSENSGQLTGYAIEIEDAHADTGYRHLGNVSEKYLLMTNAEVRAVGLEIAEGTGLPFAESRAFFDGGRFALVIDFGHEVAQDVGVAGEPDPVGLSLVLRSSYDQSWRFEAAIMAKRFLCDNGLLAGEFFARVSFRHTTGSASEDWREVVRQGLRLVHRAPADLARFCTALRRLRQAQTSDKRLREAWALFPQMGDSIVGKVMRRYVEHEEPTLYGLLNAGTNVFWHNPRQTAADWGHNDSFVSGLVTYANERREAEAVEARLLRADEMYFEGELEADSYRWLKAKLKADLDRARQAFELAGSGGATGAPTVEEVENAVDLLESLPSVWARADARRDPEALYDLSGSIMPEKVAFDGASIRTPFGPR